MKKLIKRNFYNITFIIANAVNSIIVVNNKTETPKKTKFDILEEIMISFQDDYETDYAQTHWVKTYKERKERLIQLQEEECELQANVIDDAHDLGFVEGVRYALNIMDMTDAGKNKELLERLLNILEK